MGWPSVEGAGYADFLEHCEFKRGSGDSDTASAQEVWESEPVTAGLISDYSSGISEASGG